MFPDNEASRPSSRLSSSVINVKEDSFLMVRITHIPRKFLQRNNLHLLSSVCLCALFHGEVIYGGAVSLALISHLSARNVIFFSLSLFWWRRLPIDSSAIFFFFFFNLGLGFLNLNKLSDLKASARFIAGTAACYSWVLAQIWDFSSTPFFSRMRKWFCVIYLSSLQSVFCDDICCQRRNDAGKVTWRPFHGRFLIEIGRYSGQTLVRWCYFAKP